VIRQLDSDGNVHLVLTPAEAPSLVQIVAAAALAEAYDLIPLTDQDVDVSNDLLSGAYLLSNSRLVVGLMEAHANHSGDDQEGLLAMFTELIERGRSVLVGAGLAGT